MKKIILCVCVLLLFSCQNIQKTPDKEMPVVTESQLLDVCCVYDAMQEEGYVYIFCIEGKQLGLLLNSVGLFYQALPGKCSCEDGSFEMPKETGEAI